MIFILVKCRSLNKESEEKQGVRSTHTVCVPNYDTIYLDNSSHKRTLYNLCNTITLYFFYLCEVKFLTVILSIYLLSLNFLQCEDNAFGINDLGIEISQNIDHDDCALDLCSPFCQCYCCHIHVINLDLYQSDLSLVEIYTAIFVHKDGMIKDITSTILQPPQVVS